MLVKMAGEIDLRTFAQQHQADGGQRQADIGFTGQKNDLLLLRLDLEGISISTGSACTAGIVQTSHVLEAFYGPDSPRLKESVRISLSPLNTEEELKQLAQTLKNIIGD